MGGQDFPDGFPFPGIPGRPQGRFNGDQEMIGQHPNKEMGFGAFLFMMENGAETEFRFQVSKGGFDPGDGHVVCPDLSRTESLPVGLNDLTAG